MKSEQETWDDYAQAAITGLCRHISDTNKIDRKWVTQEAKEIANDMMIIRESSITMEKRNKKSTEFNQREVERFIESRKNKHPPGSAYDLNSKSNKSK